MKKIITTAIIIVCTLLFNINLLAHSSQLDVEYDACLPISYTDGNDGYNEKWYEISANIKHISEDIMDIKYYFNPTSRDNTYTWTSDTITFSQANNVKRIYKQSMEKWNNVYYYKYDENGNIIKHKLINVVEGTATDNNLVIYPVYNPYFDSSAAMTEKDNDYSILANDHSHYSKWYMEVNTWKFIYGRENDKPIDYNKIGAHEIGHVLGLRDIDSIEGVLKGYSPERYHHEELLMGYFEYPNIGNDNYQYQQTEITYKDLIGAAINRGLHTDEDHIWMSGNNCYNDIKGQYKLICSLCNGIKYVSTLNDYTYLEYGSCGSTNGDPQYHNLDSGNMIPVASYGNKDYYKCKYCRYVAPFTDIVEQAYIYDGESDNHQHKVINSIEGLEYTTYENHSYSIVSSSIKKCITCNYYTNTNKTFTPVKTGYYDIKLISDENITYPSDCLQVSIGGELLTKYSLSGYNNESSNKFGAKNIIVYLETGRTYDIDFNIHEASEYTIDLNISNVEECWLDSLDYYNGTNNNTVGDNIKQLDIKMAGRYQFDINYTGNQESNILFILLEINENNSYDTINTRLLNIDINMQQLEYNLMPGKYYIGYFNLEEGNFFIEISRKVSYSSTFILDPLGALCGTEVTLNLGDNLANTMTCGYSRIAYLYVNAPSISRTDYHWYSSDESAASVTSFATIIAKEVTTIKTITIVAVYMHDFTKVLKKEIVILPEYREGTEYLSFGIDVRESGAATGTMVSSGYGTPRPVSTDGSILHVKKGYTRLVCLGRDSLGYTLQDYRWITNNSSIVTVSEFGTIRGIATGYATIVGVYKYNPRYMIIIETEVIN